MITAEFDKKSLQLVEHMKGFSAHWDELMHKELADYLSKAAIEYMKPLTHKRPSKGDLAGSLHFKQTRMDGHGFELELYGNWYGNLVDQGSPGGPDQVYEASKYTKNGKVFAVGKREGGNVTLSPFFHGMFHLLGGEPMHFTEKTAEHLSGEAGMNKAEDLMNEFLNWWVNV